MEPSSGFSELGRLAASDACRSGSDACRRSALPVRGAGCGGWCTCRPWSPGGSNSQISTPGALVRGAEGPADFLRSARPEIEGFQMARPAVGPEEDDGEVAINGAGCFGGQQCARWGLVQRKASRDSGRRASAMSDDSSGRGRVYVSARQARITTSGRHTLARGYTHLSPSWSWIAAANRHFWSAVARHRFGFSTLKHPKRRLTPHSE